MSDTTQQDLFPTTHRRVSDRKYHVKRSLLHERNQPWAIRQLARAKMLTSPETTPTDRLRLLTTGKTGVSPVKWISQETATSEFKLSESIIRKWRGPDFRGKRGERECREVIEMPFCWVQQEGGYQYTYSFKRCFSSYEDRNGYLRICYWIERDKVFRVDENNQTMEVEIS